MKFLFKCKSCGREKEAKAFSQHGNCKSGFDLSRCKACKKAAWDWKQVPLEKRVYNRTKTRAKRLGREFTITLEDVTFPDVCPVFGTKFEYGNNDLTYSIDRIDNSKGYIPGNIEIISGKANRIKNSATKEEITMLYNYMRRKL